MIKNKALRIACAVIALILLGLALDAVNWYASPDSTDYAFEGKTQALNPEDSILVRCTWEDGIYEPAEDDPHILFPVSLKRVTCLVIRLNAPLAEDTDIQVFYAKKDKPFSETRSEIRRIPAGESAVRFDIPRGGYAMLRLDIDGRAEIKNVTAGMGKAVLAKKAYPYRFLSHLRATLIPAAVLLLCLLLKKQKRILRFIESRFLDDRTRYKALDYVYAVFACAMLLHVIYTAVAFFLVQPGEEIFRIPMLVFAAVSILLGRMWKDKGFRIFLSLLIFIVVRTAIVQHEELETIQPYLVLGAYAFFGCYSTGRAVRPEMRRTFLLVFCALWTVSMTAVSAAGIYAANAGIALGDVKTLQVLYNRLYLVRHPVVSGILESTGVAVAVLGFALCRKKAGKALFILAILPMMLAGILTASRSDYLLTGMVFAMAVCLLLYDRLNPVKGKNGRYRLPVWKWGILVLAFAAVTAAAAVVQPFAIDAFNARTESGLLLGRAAAEEAAEAAAGTITNRNFSNAGVLTLASRIYIWEGFLKTVRADPKILLCGTYLDSGIKAVNSHLNFTVFHCHNMMFQLTLEYGLPAALLYLGFRILTLFHAYRLMSDRDRPFWQRLAPVPAIICIIAETVDITSHFKGGNPQMVILFLFAGFTVALSCMPGKAGSGETEQPDGEGPAA